MSAVVFELLVVVLLAIVVGVSSWDGSTSTTGSAHLVVSSVMLMGVVGVLDMVVGVLG